MLAQATTAVRFGKNVLRLVAKAKLIVYTIKDNRFELISLLFFYFFDGSSSIVIIAVFNNSEN